MLPVAVNSNGVGGAVNRVRFGNDEVGYIFGKRLYSTHDGGKHWAALRLGGSNQSRLSVRSLEISRNRAYVWASGPNGGRLYSSSIAKDRFTVVSGVAAQSTTGLVAAGGGTVAVLTRSARAGVVWIADAPSVRFVRHRTPCTALVAAAIGVAGARAMSLVCDGRTPSAGGHVARQLFGSSNRGASWRRVRGIPQQLHTVGLAQPTSAEYAIAATGSQGASIFMTHNGGVRWTTPLTVPQSNTLSDFGFTDPQHGFLTAIMPDATTQTWRTTNGGTRWTFQSFTP